MAKPDWLKVRLETAGKFAETSKALFELGLSTVCDGAHCPNKCECWGKGTATFMVLGEACTRRCGFCTVKNGVMERPDETEPERLAQAVSRLRLNYVVVTSVTRDDLPDGGAAHFARCVEEAKKAKAIVEVLIPDFSGRIESLRLVVDAGPHVLGHNIETVRELTGKVRDPRAGYETSLSVLRMSKRLNPEIKTKSSLMLGLGESREQVVRTMKDLREAKVDILTLGQYLRPSDRQVPVERYVPPKEFAELKEVAEKMGFACSAGPFVRSSYMAKEMFEKCGGSGTDDVRRERGRLATASERAHRGF